MKNVFLVTLALLGALLLVVLLMASRPEPALARLPSWESASVQETVVSVAGYNGLGGSGLLAGPLQGYALSLPLVARGAQGGLDSTIYLQNPAAVPAQVTVTLYYSSGVEAYAWSDTLPAHGSAGYPQATMAALPQGFEGSARVQSDQPILSVVNARAASGGLVSYVGAPMGSDAVYVPRAARESYDWSTDLWVQNVGFAPASVTLYFRDSGGNPTQQVLGWIPALGSHVFRLDEMAGLPPGFYGSVLLTSFQPLAVVAVDSNAGDADAYAYNAPGAGDTGLLVLAPWVAKDAGLQVQTQGGWNSVLDTTNIGTLSADVMLTFYDSGIALTPPQLGTLPNPFSLLPGAKASVFLPAIAGLPAGAYALVAESTEPQALLTVLANSSLAGDGMAANLGVAGSSLTTVVHLPRVAHIVADGVHTEFSIFNPWEPTSLDIRFYDQSGALTRLIEDAFLGHGSVMHLSTESVPELGANWQGSVRIDSAQLIVADAVQFITQEVIDKPWLFLVYLSGDNDLEEDMWRVVADLTAGSASATDAQAMVLWDGAGQNDSALYRIADGERTPLTPPWLPPELDMGDPQTLVDFVQWSRATVPATYTLLSIRDHGGGWSPQVRLEEGGQAGAVQAPQTLFPSLAHYLGRGGTGMSWDLTTPGGDADYLSTAELRQALESATDSATQPVDVLFYDACLTAMFEEIYALAPYALYYVSSENQVWSPGVYDEYLSAVGPGTTPDQLAISIVYAYESALARLGAGRHPYTLSALDLSQVEDVRTAFGGLALRLDELVPVPAVREQIYQAYDDTQVFDSDSDFSLEPGRESYVDLYHLALNLAVTVTDTEVISRANDLIGAWDAGLIRAEAHGSGIPWIGDDYWDLENAHGMAVYLPLGEELTMIITHTSGLTEALPIRNLYSIEESPDGNWREFLNDFISAEWHSGLQSLPDRPVAYLQGPRDGIMPAHGHRIFVPIILRSSN
jgi:hypothetical protein